MGALLLTLAVAGPTPPAPAARAVDAPPARPTEAVTAAPAEGQVGAAGAAADLAAEQQRAAEQERASALAAAASAHQDLAAAQAQLAALSLRAAGALEAYASAVRRQQSATQAEDAAQQQLAQAGLAADAAHRDLARWARAAYIDGPLADSPLAVLLLTGAGTADLDERLAAVAAVGRSRDRALRAGRATELDRAHAVTAAAAATTLAVRAQNAAASARADSDAAVTAQRQAVLAVAAQAAMADDRAVDATQRAAGAGPPVTGSPFTAGGLRVGAGDPAGSVGSARPAAPVNPACPNAPTDLSSYPNGRIPDQALCPLGSAPGHRLRADAAAAFEAMSAAYGTVFGSPICVTDSYRSYAAQVDVYARRPALAARPGTSDHGWGTAVDLCGGVQSFSTAQHRWLVLNAPLFGWFHPAWAEPGGSRPEPWHFEFGG